MTIMGGGNVGIGTTSPSELLDVQKAGTVAVRIYNTSSTADAYFDAKNSTGNAFFGINATGQYLYTSNNIPTLFYNSGSERMRITNTGNVGIGTSSPLAKLQVSSGRAYFFSGDNYSIGLAQTAAQGNYMYLGTATDGTFYISETSGTARVTVQQGGNVGIGNTAPNEKLELSVGNGVAGGLRINYAASATGEGMDITYLNNGSTTTSFDSRYNNDSAVMQFRMKTAATPVTAMTILGNGNVGIGTTTPSSSLHVVGTITAATTVDSGRINLGTQDTNQIGLYRDNTYDLVLVQNAASGNPLYLTGAGDVRVSIDSNNNSTNSKFIVGNDDVKSSNELFSVDELGSGYFSGSLTVQGTITAQKLNVQQITSSVVYSSGSNIFGNSLSNTQTFTGSIQATGSSHYLLGNVGIGTTSPQTLLTLNGPNVSYAGQLQIVAPDYAQITFYSSSATTPGSSNRKASLIYNVGGNTFEVANQITNGHLILQGSDSGGGNVGIGTDNPSYKLDVNGGFRVDGTNGDFIIDSTGNDIYFTRNDTNYFYADQANSAISFMLGAGYSQSLYLKNNGFVGINTTNPTAKLDVNGNSKFVAGFSSYTTDGLFNTDALPGVYVSTPGGSRGTYLGYRDFGGGQYWGRIGVSGSVAWSLGIGNSAGTNFSIGLNNDSSLDYFTVLSGSGNIGIGTTSPTQLLHIVGTNAANNGLTLQNTNASGNSQLRYLNTSGTEVAAITYINGTTSTVYHYTAAGGNLLNLVGANVGIGTTSPAFKLDVNGDSATRGTEYILQSVNNTTGYLYFDHSGTQVWKQGIFNDNTSTFSIGNGGGFDRLFNITNAGNVGIGTTSPESKLQIGQSFSSTSGTNKLITINAGGYYSISSGTQYNVMGFSPTTIDTSDIYTQTTGESVKNFYLGVVSEAAYFNSNRFSIFQGGAERLTIQGYGASVGNVGIGTTSPAYKLDVAGGSGFRDTLRILSSGTDTVQLSWTSTNNGVINVFNGGSVTTQIIGNGNTYFNGGNVGIGTTIPGSRLQVTATSNSTTTVDNGITILNDSGTTGCFAGIRLSTYGDSDGGLYPKQFIGAIRNSAGGGKGDIVFLNKDASDTSVVSASDEKMRITFGGNVGIGTTNPARKLHVVGTEWDNDTGGGVIFGNSSSVGASLTLQPLASNVTNGTKGWAMYAGAPGAAIGDGNLGFWAHGTNEARLTIKRDGSVGIGTTSPNVKLQVVGPSLTINDESTYGLWVSETGDDTKAIILGYDQGIDAGIITAVDKATAWKNLILQPNLGGVGVGVTSPSYKLHVSGAIAIENQGTTTIESTTFSGSLTGNTNIAFVPTGSFKAAFFDYYVASGSTNMRAGTIMAVQNNSTSRYTDTSTGDIGSTSAVDFSTSVLGGNLVLTANISSGTWEIKTAYRAL
jgi:hypothetical protein